MSNPIVYFNVAINGAYQGRIVMELYADLYPITAENFRALCTGEKGRGFFGVPLHYKGSGFNFVKHGGYMVGGNIVSQQENGLGESIYGAHFKPETSEKKHDKPGTLSMDAGVTGEEGTLGSQFIICTRANTALDKAYSVFGQVVDGMKVVYAINNTQLSSGRPSKTVTITDCGQIINTKVFFDIEIDDTPEGRIVFELFDDTTPMTARNFRALCTGEKGDSKKTGKPLHYKDSTFFRIIPDKSIHGGDIHVGDGTDIGESIYGPGNFRPENFVKKHAKAGLLSMLSTSHGRVVGSQFFITTSATSWLDDKHVVFGQVVEGIEVVQSINQVGKADGKTTMTVKIANCGQIYH